MAKQYDENNYVINPDGDSSCSIFAPPELTRGNMVLFGKQADIFGLAASIYYLLTLEKPIPVMDFSDQDKELRENLRKANCSEQFIDAVVKGLQFSATSRPENAQAFLNLFPGCEDIQL